jgi:hypothetical protein
MNGISRSTREWIASASPIRQTPIRQQIQIAGRSPSDNASTMVSAAHLVSWSVGPCGDDPFKSGRRFGAMSGSP